MSEEQEQNAAHERREAVVRRIVGLMGWDYHTSPVWGGLRKVALAEAVVLGVDKAEAIAAEIERLRAAALNGVDAAVAEEREACAALAERTTIQGAMGVALCKGGQIAEAIRARHP